MFSLRFILFACLSFFYTDASYVDLLPKCSIKDNKCMIDLFQKIFHDIGETGIPEINLNPIDPMQINNVSIPVLDGIIVTVKDGVIKGFKNCKVNSFTLELEKQFSSTEVTCDVLTIKGVFAIEGSNPLLQGLFATDAVHGEGKTKIKLEKISVVLDLPVKIIKKDDGETYFDILTDKSKYTYDLQNMKFEVKNLIIGKNDFSPFVTQYMNENWKAVFKAYGKAFMNKSMAILYSFLHIFYGSVSTNKLIVEDLSSYINN